MDRLLSIYDLQAFVPSQYTINDFFHQNAEVYPTKVIYTWIDNECNEIGKLTNYELKLGAYKVAGKLLSKGVKQGDRVVLVYPPCIEFTTAFFGCIIIGVIAVPVFPPDPRNAKKLENFRHIVTNCGASVALTDHRYRTAQRFAKGEWPSLKWISTDRIKPKTIPIAEEAIKQIQVKPEDIAFLQYTSGSTSFPKGVMLTHGNVCYDIFVLGRENNYDASEVAMCWVPQYHDFGLIGGIIGSVVIGFSVVLMSPMDFIKKPVSYLHATTKFKGTIIGGPNFGFELLVKRATDADMQVLDLSSVRVAANGAEPVRGFTVRNFINKFAPVGFNPATFKPMYGLAEHCVFVSAHPLQDHKIILPFNAQLLRTQNIAQVDDNEEVVELVSAGFPWGIDLRIINPETRSECPPNTVGEIWITSPGLGKGYWQLEEVTQLTFGNSYTLANGQNTPAHYFRTGDFGFVYENNLFINGRLKDLIIIRGKNIFPQDIELLVEQSSEHVRPGCVAAFAVEVAHEEQIVVVCEVREGVSGPEQLKEIAQNIKSSISSGLSVVVWDVVIIPTRTIAKTSSGKIQRQQCKANYNQNKLRVLFSQQNTGSNGEAETISLLPPSHVLPHMQLLQSAHRKELLLFFLKQEVRNTLNIQVPLDDFENANLIDLGMDSMASAALWEKIAQIQDSNPISPTLLYDHPDIKSIGDQLAPVFDQIFEGNSKKYHMPTEEKEAKMFLTFFCLMLMKISEDGHLWPDVPAFDTKITLSHENAEELSNSFGSAFRLDMSDWLQNFQEGTSCEVVVDQLYEVISKMPVVSSPLEIIIGDYGQGKSFWSLKQSKQIACGIGQILAMILFAGLAAALIFGPLHFFQKFAGDFSFRFLIFSADTQYNFSRYAIAAIFVPIFVILFSLEILLVTIPLKWVIIGKYKEGSYPIYGFYYFRWWIVHTLLSEFSFFTWIISNTCLLVWWYRLLGAKIGKKVSLSTCELREFDLIELSNGVSMAGSSKLITHRFSEGNLILERVRVGAKCSIGSYALVTDPLLDGVSVTPNAYSKNIKIPNQPEVKEKPSAPFFFQLCQVLGLVLMAFLCGGCILPFMAFTNHVYATGKLNEFGYYTPLLFIFIGFTFFSISLSAVTVLLKWVLIFRIRANKTYSLYGFFALRKWWVDKLVGLTNRLVVSNLMLTYFNKWYYELLGLKIGKNVILSRVEFSLEDVDLLTINDNAFVGAAPRLSYASTAKNENGKWEVTFACIELGERSWIGAWCSIVRGVTIGKDSVVSDYSHVSQSTAEESFVLGLPNATAFKKSRKKGVAPEKPITLLHHLTKFSLETLVLCVLIFVKFTSLIPGYRVLQVIVDKGNDNLYANVAGLVLLFIIGTIYMFIFAIIVQLTGGYALGKKEKRKPMYSAATFTFVISFINFHVLLSPVLTYLRGTCFTNLVFKMLGAKIGKDVFIFSPKVSSEFQLLSIGDRTIINEDGLIILHSFKNFEFNLIPATVGSDCNFGSWSSVHSNTVGDRVIFSPGAKPMPGMSVKTNVYTNNPAEVFRKQRKLVPSVHIAP